MILKVNMWLRKVVTFNNSYHNFEDLEIEKLFKRKTGTALWIALECKRPSKREVLVEKLKKYVPIDIAGNCGNISCWGYPYRCIDYNTTYKFYLAFENSLCQDYLTEKTFKVMDDYIIPVIYSGVELTRFLPPKSYIDVNDFENVEALGKYLKFLSENVKEYKKYFWWKKYYKVVQKKFDLCDICKKLNEPNLHRKKQVYTRINEWFNKNVCSKPKIKFWSFF